MKCFRPHMCIPMGCLDADNCSLQAFTWHTRQRQHTLCLTVMDYQVGLSTSQLSSTEQTSSHPMAISASYLQWIQAALLQSVGQPWSSQEGTGTLQRYYRGEMGAQQLHSLAGPCRSAACAVGTAASQQLRRVLPLPCTQSPGSCDNL